MLLSDGAVAPISFGDASPLQAYANYYPVGGMGLTGSFATYGEIYKRQLWVATVVDKVAASGSRLPFKTYRRTDTGRQDARDTPLGRLMAQPNSRHDPVFFWLWTFSTFEVYGEALWLKVRAAPNRPPVELWPLHPSNVYTRRNDDGTLTYMFHIGTATVPLLEIPERDVVHFRRYSPDSQVRGMSRLEPLRQTLINEDAARRATTGFWQNGARPATFLTHPKTLGAEALQRLRATFDNLHAGVDNYAKTAILEEGMEPHTVSLSAEEAQYIETRRLNREEVCAVYDVPPPVVHILDRATFSNITEQMRSMYRDTMAPRLGLFEAALHSQLTADFADDSLYCEFLMDEVLRGDFEARMQAYKDGIGSGILKPKEARDRENLPDAGPDTDRLYINSSVIPLGSAAGASATGHEVIVTPQRTKTIDKDSAVTVLGRLGRSVSLDDVNPDHLVANLNGDAVTVLAVFYDALASGDDVLGLRRRIQAAGKEPAT